jgi:hypothetical protein
MTAVFFGPDPRRLVYRLLDRDSGIAADVPFGTEQAYVLKSPGLEKRERGRDKQYRFHVR